MTAAAPAPLDEATIVRVVQMSRAEAAAGRMPESDRLLASVAQQAPNHPAVLNELGVRMLDRGAPQQAQALFARATSVDPKHPALWANLASSLKALGSPGRGTRCDRQGAGTRAAPPLGAAAEGRLPRGPRRQARRRARLPEPVRLPAAGGRAARQRQGGLRPRQAGGGRRPHRTDRGARGPAGRDPRAAQRTARAARGPVPRDFDGDEAHPIIHSRRGCTCPSSRRSSSSSVPTSPGSMPSRPRPPRCARSCCRSWSPTARDCSPTSTTPWTCRWISSGS